MMCHFTVSSTIVLRGQTYFYCHITFTQSAATKTYLAYRNLIPLMKINGNRREVSGGDIKYIPSGPNMFYELVSHEALGNLIHMNAFTNYVYLVRAQEQITFFFSLQGICK